ncbi:MAG: DASS family sodium-coupled anion symporter [Phycisphaerales bacterium]|nr:DASS family sodium-coupled anion symporter [Phycisphaerales bacterium]
MPERAAHPEATPAEAASPRLAWAGRCAGPPLALLVFFLLPSSLPFPTRAAAAVMTLMGALWMTEALPLAATSLLPLVLFPLLGVLTVQQAAEPYADKVIFLFLGGFLIALAMERSGLHRRIALRAILLFGTTPRRLIAGSMIATAFLSCWISNTASAMMMLPIGLSMAGLLRSRLAQNGADPAAEKEVRRFEVGLLLGIGYAASVGGLGTPIGTPPNLVLQAFLERELGAEVPFAQWMLMAMPLVVVMLAALWAMLCFVLFRVSIREIPGGRDLIRSELVQLGPIGVQEKVVLAVFLSAAFAWIARDPLTRWDWFANTAPFIRRVDDTVIAVAAALILFTIPISRKRVGVLEWADTERLPWGVLLLFGGGLSLAAAMKASGLDAWIGEQAVGLGSLPTPLLILGICAMVVLLSEFGSNTAVAATFLPVIAGVAVAIGVDPMLLLLPAALAATCGFMLPAGTPPNAIVFGSGKIQIHEMVRAGFLLDIIGIVLITALMYTVAPLVLDFAHPATQP